MLTTLFVQMRGAGLPTKGFSLSGRKCNGFHLLAENSEYDDVLVNS